MIAAAARLNAEVQPASAQEFGAFLAGERDKWTEVVLTRRASGRNEKRATAAHGASLRSRKRRKEPRLANSGRQP